MSLKRCKKLTVVLLAVGLILGLMSIASAQQESGLRVKAGYFMPSDTGVENLWGSGLTLGVDYLYAFPPYGVDFGAEYFSKEDSRTLLGITVKQDWRVVPVTATFLFFPSGGEGFSAYMGGGIGYYLTKYGLDIAVSGLTLLAGSMEESGIGFHVQGGFTLGKNFFAELKWSTAEIQNLGIDVGGLEVVAGYKF
jgi:hypothetical protein